MKGTYRTRQKEELAEYLKSTKGRHITAGDIVMHFQSQGKNIGTATVYRQLDRMVEEGLVTKYNIDENTSACYEFIDPINNCHHPVCYHCKCEKCGKLFHLECIELNHLRDHMEEEHGFRIDPARTVIYGLCADCRKKSEE